MKRLCFKLAILLCIMNQVAAEPYHCKRAIETNSLERFKFGQRCDGWRLKIDKNLRDSLLKLSKLKSEELTKELNHALENKKHIDFERTAWGLLCLGTSAAAGTCFYHLCNNFEKISFYPGEAIVLGLGLPLGCFFGAMLAVLNLPDGIYYQQYLKNSLKNQKEIRKILKSLQMNQLSRIIHPHIEQ